MATEAPDFAACPALSRALLLHLENCLTPEFGLTLDEIFWIGLAIADERSTNAPFGLALQALISETGDGDSLYTLLAMSGQTYWGSFERLCLLVLQAGWRLAGYDAYLKSPVWRAIRDEVFARALGRCQLCSGRAEHCHHNNYFRLAHELPSDVIALCAECHRKHHGIAGPEPED